MDRSQDDFGQITRQIEGGELDGSAAIWRSEDREAHMLFSAPYFENHLVLVGTRKNRVTGVTLEDLSESLTVTLCFRENTLERWWNGC